MANEEQKKIDYTVWRTFERKINGKLEQFWIQILFETDKEKSLNYLCEIFPKDEPISRALDISNDRKSSENIRKLWKEKLEENISLGCYTKLENGENKLVAFNCLMKKTTKEQKHVEGEALKIIFGIFEYMDNLKNPLKELELNCCLASFGLATLPDYRGYNIGLELLKARENLCKLLGLKASISNSTGPASQRLAEKAGYKELVSITYDEIGRNNPALKIPNINNYSKIIKKMYLKYE